MTKEEAIKYLQQLYPNGGHCWLDEQRIEAIGMAVKALQEEPVSIDFEQELYKAFGQVKDFTLGMQIAKWFYDIGKKSREPVSDDLEEAAISYVDSFLNGDLGFNPNLLRKEACSIGDVEKELNMVFKAGAKWQKQIDKKDEDEMLLISYMDGVEKGKKQMREQMLKDATEVTVHIDAGNYPYIPQIELYDYDNDKPLAEEGQKVKVVILKQ